MASKEDYVLEAAIGDLAEPMDTSYCDDAVAAVLTICEENVLRRRETLLGTSRIENYVEETVPRYSDPLFRAHFRMTRASFQDLLQLIGPHTQVKTISLERRTLACLWYLSNQETFRSVVDRFGMSKGSLKYYLMNFCRTMTSDAILPNQITWPQKEAYRSIAEKHASKYGFPGVIGFVDGTYIPIPGPHDFRDSYICRKGFPAFHLQGVCDNRLRFLDVFSGYPGSVHDSRVFRNSPISHLLVNEPLPEEYHLLGDSAYALSTYMLVPYRDNGHLTEEEKRYNSVHSSTRVDIERCFGLLKGRYRKLKYLDMRNVREIPVVIVTCCVLHNFVINRESFMDEDIDLDGTDTDGTRVTSTSLCEQQRGIDKRKHITQLLS